MFCPKCRKTKGLPEDTHSSWKLLRANSAPHCIDCGTLLCSDRLASEFYKSGYKPNAAVHGHKLDGLLSVSRLLIETRADSSTAEQNQSRSVNTENNLRSPFSTVITSHDEIGTRQGYDAERVGRYDNLPALDGLDPEPESTQYSGLIRSKPSPWPVIAIVILMEVLISFGVYAIHSREVPSHPKVAVSVAQDHAKRSDPIKLSLIEMPQRAVYKSSLASYKPHLLWGHPNLSKPDPTAIQQRGNIPRG